MFPWGHLAVGYLTYTVLTKVWAGRAPASVPTVALAVGTQFPDLVDKPLGWWFGVYDGRAVGHSLPVAVAVCVGLVYLARRYDRQDVAAAFSVGVFTHLAGDASDALVTGNLREASFLLWPVLAPPSYPKDSLVDHLGAWLVQGRILAQSSPTALLESRFGFQLAMFVLLVVIWAMDGFPGVGTVWSLVTRREVRSRDA
jgi:hypothetical protein